MPPARKFAFSAPKNEICNAFGARRGAAALAGWMCERFSAAGETSGKPLMYVGATPATRPFICRCAAALRAAWRRLRRRFLFL